MHTQKFPDAIQNIFTVNYKELTIKYVDNVLSITAHSKSNLRPLYLDLYYLDVFTMLNQTVEVELETDILVKFPVVENTKDPAQLVINKNLRATARRY
jgi:hypothetical protein